MVETEKSAARLSAKLKRLDCQNNFASRGLTRHFPALKFRGSVTAGYWPISDEIDILPLLRSLDGLDYKLSLPCVVAKNAPLKFRSWSYGDPMKTGLYKLQEPLETKQKLIPNLIFVPLLAFTATGKRLGYGGGYYDRTLEALRRKDDVFACGVAYAGQETPELPTDEHDQTLDGILTENYFKVF